MKFVILVASFCVALAVPRPQTVIEANYDDIPDVIPDDNPDEFSDYGDDTPLYPRNRFPILRFGTYFPNSISNVDGVSMIRRRPSVLDIFLNRLAGSPVPPVFFDPSDEESNAEDSDFDGFLTGDSNSSIDDLPDNYNNSTYDVTYVNGTKVEVNETIKKVSGDNFNTFSEIKIFHFTPDNETNSQDEDFPVDDPKTDETKLSNDEPKTNEKEAVDGESSKDESETSTEITAEKSKTKSTKDEESKSSKKNVSASQIDSKGRDESKRYRRSPQHGNKPILFPTSLGRNSEGPVSFSSVYSNINGNTYEYSINHQPPSSSVGRFPHHQSGEVHRPNPSSISGNTNTDRHPINEDVETISNTNRDVDRNDDDIITIGGIRPPDLSSDTRVNFLAVERSNRGQGMVMTDPDAEIFDLPAVLREFNSHVD